MGKVRDRLIGLAACSEAVKWAESYPTIQAAWEACDRADWMLWLIREIDGSITPRCRLAMCACARTALQYVPAGEDRPRIAIETAERHARGEATDGELETARKNAYAAYAAAAYAAAANAAYAAYAAAYAYDVAANAANAAANAAAAAARAQALSTMADRVREIVPVIEPDGAK